MTPDRIDALEQEQIRAALARLRSRLPVGLSEDELMEGYKMSDVAKCAGTGCKVRDYCDRFVRPVVDGQTWIEPRWCSLPSGRWDYPRTASCMSCMDWKPLPKLDAVPAHGGASEEGDGA